MVWVGWALRIMVVIVASWVLAGLVPLVLDEFRGIDACPMLGPLPACFPVGLGYFAMAIAALFSPRKLTVLFLLGWAPVFLLALTGSILEIFGRTTCPASPAGTPLCNFSLAVASLILPVFLLSRHFQPAANNKD